MRAGALTHVISLERSVAGEPNDMGTVKPEWKEYAVMRAQIVRGSTEEFIRNYGASDETTIIFRIRFLLDVMLADRLKFNSGYFNIKELVVIGRNKGLEIRCIERRNN